MSGDEEPGAIMGEIELGAAAESTVQAYKELATDPSKRMVLAKDTTCIHFLAYVIAEGAGSLIQTAVDTIDLLSQSPECRSPIANTFGILEALQEMADDARYCEELRDQAISLFTCLQYSRHIKSSNTAQTPQDDTDSSVKNLESKPASSRESKFTRWNSSIKVEKTSDATSKRSENAFPGALNAKAKIVTLFVKNMSNQSQRRQIEDELIKVRGLISIVFDLAHSRVTCRVKKDLSVDKLAAAVARTEQFQAQQVVPGNDGEEKVMDITDSRSHASAPVEELPDYLPEEDSPIKDITTAMAPSGSLRETATTLLSAAANLLQKSFYW